MKQILFGLFAGVVVSMAAAAPTISADSVRVERGADRLAVSYVLADEPAVVTVQFQTNGVDLAATDFSEIVGDVATVVQPGERAFVWYAAKAMPELVVEAPLDVVVKAWPTNAPPPFMVVDLAFPGLVDRNDGLTNYVDVAGRVVQTQLREAVRFYASEAMLPGGAGANCDRYKTDFLLLKRIDAANVTWWMGSPDGETLKDKEPVRNCDGSRETPHQVTLAADYYVGVFEVTQAQLSRWSPGRAYKSSWDGVDTSRHPADNISYTDLRGSSADWPSGGHAVSAGSVLGVLRRKTGSLDDYPFDLPTEAQWEYAARGGCGAAFQNGVEDATAGTDGVLAAIDGICRYKGNGGDWSTGKNPKDDAAAIGHTTAVVGSYAPNGFGLYDVQGNVAELCLDYYAAEAYTQDGYDAATGPTAPDSSGLRCMRGGYAGGSCNPHCLRLAKRTSVSAGAVGFYLGFRLCCPARAVFAPVPTF